MPFKRKNSKGGFVEYIATVVVIILILIGLRVDVRRYAAEHNIPSLVLDSKVFVENHIIDPVVHLWTEKIKPFLLGQRFGSLRQKIESHTTVEE